MFRVEIVFSVYTYTVAIAFNIVRLKYIIYYNLKIQDTQQTNRTPAQVVDSR